jgi:dihydroneopterin aldolase
MDKITLRGMVFQAHHGYTKNERDLGSRFEVDCELWGDLKSAGRGDDLSKSVDARHIYRLVSSIVLREKFRTIEALAEKISEGILKKHSVERVVVRVRKPNPPRLGVTDSLEVEIERKG